MMHQRRNVGRPTELLMVEDDPGDARLAHEALRESGLGDRLTVVGDGIEALAFLRREDPYAQAPRPDLILADLDLPRMSGRQFLAELKADPALRRIPVVLFTGSEADEDVAAGYDLHGNCYVVKPADYNGFARALQSIRDFWLTTAKLPYHD